MFFAKVVTKSRTVQNLGRLIHNANLVSSAINRCRYFNTSQRNPDKNEDGRPNLTQCVPEKNVYMDPQGKVAVITGGVTGIGIAAAYELLNAGGRVVICAGPDFADKTGAIQALNDTFGKGKALYIPADIAYEKDLENLFDHAINRYSKIDIFLNNGGVWNDSEWENCIDTNISGTIRGNLLALELMGKNQKGKYFGGVVVNCASTLAFDAMPTCPAFCASQHAIIGLTQCLGDPFHVRRNRLRVMTLCPDVTITDLSFNDPKHQHALRICSNPKEQTQKKYLPSTYAVARAFLYIIKYGISGRHYVVDGALMTEMTYPPITEFIKPVCRYKKKIFGFI